ncbi:MAG: methylcrotonoyl-CoA carboxylase [Salinivirgaceae bacterium]|nr:MAG: methylcrotonoyl-CoA carboxylase [Salinivirgaceae bacterium]
MKIVREKSELKDVIKTTSREAKSYFGDDSIFVEQFIEDPRHIEIQVLGDKHGNVIHVYERECSIQRRYQKIIEESPSPTLNQETREKMGEEAVKIAKSIGYDSAGTIEFLVDKNLNYYFLEMNTRIQVEHPVTEMVTGIDLVQEQIKIAAGKKLEIRQKDVKQNGHAIEARIYAEDAENDFAPAPGDITYYFQPENENVRIDSSINKAVTIQSNFDPMISKVIAFGENRDAARISLIESLENHVIHGIKTNIPFLTAMLNSKQFVSNQVSTKFCDLHADLILKEIDKKRKSIHHEEYVIGFALHSLGFKTNNRSIWENIGFWRINQELKINFLGNEYLLKFKRNKEKQFVFYMNDLVFNTEVLNQNKNYIECLINNNHEKFSVSLSPNHDYFINEVEFNFNISRSDELIEEDFFTSAESVESANIIHSPMPGKVVEIKVKEGDDVSKGDTLLIVEAMKMENSIKSGIDSKVEKININVGDAVSTSDVLIELSEIED